MRLPYEAQKTGQEFATKVETPIAEVGFHGKWSDDPLGYNK